MTILRFSPNKTCICDVTVTVTKVWFFLIRHIMIFRRPSFYSNWLRCEVKVTKLFASHHNNKHIDFRRKNTRQAVELGYFSDYLGHMVAPQLLKPAYLEYMTAKRFRSITACIFRWLQSTLRWYNSDLFSRSWDVNLESESCIWVTMLSHFGRFREMCYWRMCKPIMCTQRNYVVMELN